MASWACEIISQPPQGRGKKGLRAGGGGGCRLSPKKEGGGGGSGNGAQTSEPLYKEIPLAQKLGRKAAQTENSFPHETYLKMHSASWGPF